MEVRLELLEKIVADAKANNKVTVSTDDIVRIAYCQRCRNNETEHCEECILNSLFEPDITEDPCFMFNPVEGYDN